MYFLFHDFILRLIYFLDLISKKVYIYLCIFIYENNKARDFK